MNDTEAGVAPVEALIDRVRSLDDADLRALARMRAAIDETFHVGAWRAAVESLATKGQAYAEAWIEIGAAFVPERLEELVQMGAGANPDEVAEWRQVARDARLAIDDALLAVVNADTIRPPDIRELNLAWKAMLEEAHSRDTAGTT